MTGLAAATAVLDSTSVPVAEGQTVVRVRGFIGVDNDQAAALENVVGAVGMFIASDQAVAVGVGSLPTPYTDQDSELYLMHQYFAVRNPQDGAGLEWSDGLKIFEFDSKAMRKMESGQTFCVVVENGSATGGMVYQFNLRYC